jgi:hypothetical protein
MNHCLKLASMTDHCAAAFNPKVALYDPVEIT